MSFVTERPIKAIRKARMCDGCGQIISIGEPAIGWAGTTDGDFGTATYHPECREAEIAMNRLAGTSFPDEWLSLLNDRDDDADEWDAWLAQEFPIVAQRFGILASVDTHPQGGDATQIAAPFMSGAVPCADTADAQITPGDSNG